MLEGKKQPFAIFLRGVPKKKTIHYISFKVNRMGNDDFNFHFQCTWWCGAIQQKHGPQILGECWPIRFRGTEGRICIFKLYPLLKIHGRRQIGPFVCTKPVFFHKVCRSKSSLLQTFTKKEARRESRHVKPESGNMVTLPSGKQR